MSLDWLSLVTVNHKSEAITEDALSSAASFLGAPLNKEEISELDNLCSSNSDINYLNWELPNYVLPCEYIELLKFSNGGNFNNGDREIGFFGLSEIRDYYLRYLFPEYQPGAIPIGFNGGGTFYAYDLRNPTDTPTIIATSSGCLDWDEIAVLGTSLKQVFSKTIDIDDEFEY